MASSIPAVAAYDPYIGRAIGSLRVALSEGYPVMVRLHPGREYEVSSEADLRTLDKEGNAVLIVGYDDQDRSFEVIDPVVSTSRRRLPYDEFGIRVVDSTLDFALIIAPLQINIARCDEEHVSISVGLFLPETPIIDESQIRVTGIQLLTTKGYITVGTALAVTPAIVTVPVDLLPDHLEIEGNIEGSRPLPYIRRVEARVPTGLLCNVVGPTR